MDDRAGHDGLETAALVLADLYASVQRIHAILVLRIHAKVGVIEGSRHHTRAIVDGLPRPAAVVRSDQLALFRLDKGVDDIRIRGRHREADSAEVSWRHAVLFGVPIPGIASVVRHVQAASRPPRLEEPRPAPELPHRREELVGIARVHDQVRGAGALVHVEHAVPRPASVPGSEDPSHLTVAPRGAHGRDVDHRGIRGMSDDPVNPLGTLESDVGPGVAAIETPEYAVPDSRRVAWISLPGAHPDHVGRRLRHGHGPDSQDGLLVEDRRPLDTAVHGSPHAPGRGPDEDDVGVRRHDVHVGDTSAHPRRTDGASFDLSEVLGGVLSLQCPSNGPPGAQHQGGPGESAKSLNHRCISIRVLILRIRYHPYPIGPTDGNTSRPAA